jgi:hypothetical protein
VFPSAWVGVIYGLKSGFIKLSVVHLYSVSILEARGKNSALTSAPVVEN